MSERADLGYSPAWRRGTEIVLPSLIRAAMKRDWHGQEHIPREGGVIIAPNHLSYADWAAVALFTYQAGRYPAFLIKSPVFDVKLIGPFLRSVGQLPVNRGQIDAALVLKDAERSLRAGECLIVYPEGTATRDPALWPMVARTGVAILLGAIETVLARWRLRPTPDHATLLEDTYVALVVGGLERLAQDNPSTQWSTPSRVLSTDRR